MSDSHAIDPAAAGSAQSPQSPFGRFLAEHAAGRKVFFEPLSGNHGDTLIRRGCEHLLARVGATLVADGGEADLIVVNGGGAMNDIWMFGITTFGHWREHFPDTPIVIGPSSFRFHGVDFPSFCRKGTAPLTIFAREEASLRILRDSGAGDLATLALSRDLAFELRDSQLIAALRPRAAAAPRHVLVSMRRDSESNAGGGLGGLMVPGKFGWLPDPIRKPLARLRDRIAAYRTVGDEGSSVAGEHAEPLTPVNAARLGRSHFNVGDASAGRLPTKYVDASIVDTFDEFLAIIADAALVVTDRLHVSVLAYLLNRPAVMLPGNNHKLAGVFHATMNHAGSSVRLMTPSGLVGGGEKAG